MKKMLLVLLACAMLFAGCTRQESKDDAAESSAAQTSESEATAADYTTSPPADAMQADFGDYSRDKVIWGPGNTVDHQRPADPVSLQKQFGDLGATFIGPDTKTICLTFDEGYENGYTPQILDTLKEKGVKAVFFVTYDFAKANPKLVQRMIDEGHIVGNHTYRHYTMDEVDLSVAEEEIRVLHDYVADTFDYEMKYFRFPKGEFSEQTLYLAQMMGYESVFWSFAYADWDTEDPPDEQEALRLLTESTHGGAIYLLHAVSATNANILGAAIDNIRAQGYTFTTDI